MYERTVNFKDADGNITTVEIEIKDGCLSMTGEYGGGCGQCEDSIVPKNDDQEELVRIWNKWHLNNMHAGTPLQEDAVNARLKETGERYDYEHAMVYLKSIALYTDHTRVPGDKYGTAWFKQDLPKDIDVDLDELCDRIEETEFDETEGCFLLSMNDKELELECDNYGEQIVALGIHLDLTNVDLDEVEEDGNCLSYGSREYFVGTYDDAEDDAREYLTDDPYMWKMAVENGDTEDGLEEWADEIVQMDGVGHILGSYDGMEYEVSINGEEYVIVRR